MLLFLAARVAGEVIEVADDGRSLTVESEEGEMIRFTLQRTTGRFQSESLTGARLYFGECAS